LSWTEVTGFQVGGAGYQDQLKKLTWNRMINGVGVFTAILDDYGEAYDDTFDVHDAVSMEVNGDTVFAGRVDGRAVDVEIVDDGKTRWGEYLVLRGVDQGQDLLFHDDFEYLYPETDQTLGDVLDDIFNTQLTTNISYTKPSPDTTPEIGPMEFKSGSGFLTQLQEVHRRANYIFYVDDNLNLVSQHVSSLTDSGQVLIAESENPVSNIIDHIVYSKKRGDKLYNYVELTGKNPMFDGYTELNVYDAGPPVVDGWIEDTIFASTDGINDTATARVGTYAIVCWNENPVRSLIGIELNAPIFNYDSWDFTKGELGVWARYDNNAGAPGTPGAGAAAADLYLLLFLTDNAGSMIVYYGDSTHIYRDYWGRCTFPLGENVRSGWVGWLVNTWTAFGGISNFNWDNVVTMNIIIGDPTAPGNAASHLYVDGISIPHPVKGVSEDAASQAAYRNRPLILSVPYIRTHNAMQSYSEQLLDQHKNSAVNEITLKTIGNTGLRYAGTSVTLHIPDRINLDSYYMTELTHIIESREDVSGGFGWDYMTELNAVEVFDTPLALDRQRLDSNPVVSGYNLARASGRGAGVK